MKPAQKYFTSTFAKAIIILIAIPIECCRGDTFFTNGNSNDIPYKILKLRETVPAVQCSLSLNTIEFRLIKPPTVPTNRIPSKKRFAKPKTPTNVTYTKQQIEGEEHRLGFEIIPDKNEANEKWRVGRRSNRTKSRNKRDIRKTKIKNNIIEKKQQSFDNLGDHDTYELRGCWCTEFYGREMEYCPGQFDTCSVEGPTGHVECYNEWKRSHTIIRTIWPLIILSMICTAIFLIATEYGSFARRYVRRKIWLSCYSCYRWVFCCGRQSPSSGITEEEMITHDVDYLLSQRPQFGAHLYRSAILRERRRIHRRLRRRQQTDQGGVNTITPRLPELCNVLRLKTRQYKPPEKATSSESGRMTLSDNDNDDDDDNELDKVHSGSNGNDDDASGNDVDDECCAICLGRLEQGCEVGDIACGHVFHKDCLKDWLQNKNTCPLCQQVGIATPGYCRTP